MELLKFGSPLGVEAVNKNPTHTQSDSFSTFSLGAKMQFMASPIFSAIRGKTNRFLQDFRVSFFVTSPVTSSNQVFKVWKPRPKMTMGFKKLVGEIL